MNNEKRSVTPEKAMELLAKHGSKVTLEEAQIILDFMYKFSKLSVRQQVENFSLNIPKKNNTADKL